MPSLTRPVSSVVSELQTGTYCTHDIEDIGLPLLTDILQMGMEEEQKW
jgi:hypothetical protein